MKLEVVKQTTNSIYCMYSRPTKHKNVSFSLYSAHIFASRFIYGKSMLTESKKV